MTEIPEDRASKSCIVMQANVNRYGQSIEDSLPGWTARPNPADVTPSGAFCRLEPLDAKHEAQFLRMNYVFEDLQYRRYEWKCDCWNAASRQAAGRLGLRFEGIFRQAVVYKGRQSQSLVKIRELISAFRLTHGG